MEHDLNGPVSGARRVYTIMTGMRNPRDPKEIGWRDWDTYQTLAEARKAARKAGLTFYTIQERRIVYVVIPK